MTKPYYETHNGLDFTCTRCGRCCERPGPVFFSDDDLDRAAAFEKITPRAFVKRHGLVKVDDIHALDLPDGTPCSFYDKLKGCQIYEGRPIQCKTWPFWKEVVTRKSSWEKAATDCPGMNQGERHSPEVIREALDACQNQGLPEGDAW